MNAKEKKELREIEEKMIRLRKLGMSAELVRLGIQRSRLLDEQYGDRGQHE